MQRFILLTLTSATALWIAAVQLTAPGAEGGAQETAQHKSPAEIPGPIVSTHELMELFNRPLYQYLLKEMQNELGEGTKWETIADRGLQAAEVMNLVAIRERKEGQAQEWMQRVREAQQSALELAAAAKQHNADQTRAAYQSLIRNCNDCHQSMAPEHAPQLRP